jgi:hypothetical protein
VSSRGGAAGPEEQDMEGKLIDPMWFYIVASGIVIVLVGLMWALGLLKKR